MKPKDTAGSDTIFIQIYMDAPPGVPGVSKEPEGLINNTLMCFCANIQPKLKKLRKPYEIKKIYPK